MITLLLVLAVTGPASAAPAPSAPAPKPAVHASTGAASVAVVTPLPNSSALMLGVSTYTVVSLYTGDRVRDPFLPPAMGTVRAHHEGGSPETIDIHSLQLHGIMKDAATNFAIFSSDFGTTLILRNGKLYDDRNRVVFGITGRIKIKQKRVELFTADKDIQVFRLGEQVEQEKPKEL